MEIMPQKDAAGIVRQDLLLTAAENFNEVTAKMEKLGLRDPEG